jgi:hypothetical protein
MDHRQPATGKLTVAEIISKQTNIPLFHNHVSRDLVKDIYGEKIGDHYDLVDKIRNDVFEYCASNDTDLIFTFVYGGTEDNEIVQKYINIVESNGDEIKFVELTVDKNDLLDRVNSESRKRFKKLKDRVILQNILESIDTYSIPFVDSVMVNTSKLSPEDSASLIIQKLKLKL